MNCEPLLPRNVPRDWEWHRLEDTMHERFYDGGWAGVAWPHAYGRRGASLIF